MRTLILFILLLPIAAFSAPAKVVFNLHGEQHLTLVGPRTEITKEAEIIWDTSKDGPIPVDAPIGYVERYEVSPGVYGLRESPALKAAVEAKAAAAAAKERATIDRRARIRAIDAANTPAELKAILKDLIVEQGL